MLEVTGVSYSLLERIEFRLMPGRVLAILGPSGCGKTTLLKIIMGVLAPDHGCIVWNGIKLTEDRDILVPAEKRHFGVVFQDGALFPHLSVRGNVAFGLTRGSAPARSSRTNAIMEEMGLTSLSQRSIYQLSGGERQRVALARAMAVEPKMLLLDEPFSSIDRLARQELIEILSLTLQRRLLPTILVTHDARDAVDLADEILLLRDGKVMRYGPIAAVLSDPGDHWSQKFLNIGLGQASLKSARNDV